MKKILKKSIILLTLGLSGTTYLFASNFNAVNKIFNLNLSSELLEKNIHYNGIDHTKYFLIMRNPSTDEINLLLTLFSFKTVFGFKMEQDPKEKGFNQKAFVKKMLPYIKFRYEIAKLQFKIIEGLMKLTLFATDDIKSLDKDIKLVEQEIAKELRWMNSTFQTINGTAQLPPEYFKFLYDTGMFNDLSPEELNQKNAVKWIRELSIEDFDQIVKFPGLKMYNNKSIYPEYFNALKLFDLKFKTPVKSNIVFGSSKEVLSFYTNLPQNIDFSNKRFDLYTMSDFKLIDGTKLISIDYRLLKLISKRWNKFTKQQKNTIKATVANNIQNELEYIARNVNIKELERTGQAKQIEKFYNYDLINNEEGIKEKVDEIFNNLGMN